MMNEESPHNHRTDALDRNSEIAAYVMTQWPIWEKEGIGPDQETIISAAAVGLVIEVWRNSPLEEMHTGGGKRGKGPDDPEMFAESTALHRHAVRALASEKKYALFSFEEHVLDRNRPWAASGRTLQEMGYGYLGAFTKHVKDRTNALLGFDEKYGRRVLLAYLIMRAKSHGSQHMGMPLWPTIVETVCAMATDPGHPAWRNADSIVSALDARPAELPSVDALRDTLLCAPYELPLPVLKWLCLWRSGPMFDAVNYARQSLS
ncbi:hypothetical protein [Streptosporangium roseum]|uniref:hypothetical protein n=1 Tax=Streptosporangium roseum TaxID=2001 RepID=UPI00331A096B